MPALRGLVYRRARGAVVVAVVEALLTAVSMAGWPTRAAEAAPGGLTIEPEHDRTGYDRSLFDHWVDADGDGCDTRDEVLIAESATPVTVTQPGCTLTGGQWHSLYDTVDTTDPSTFDIDHLIPLAEAWDSGAWAWDSARREAFANDLGYPDALVAVTASSNRSKSDQDPAEWQPPDTSVACWYATAWVETKIRWDLTADDAEADALDTMLATCDHLPPGGTFLDDDGNPHEPMIEAIAARGITGGCNPDGTLYCPTTPVRRDQMATFIARAFGLPAATIDHFSDDNGNPHETNINRVAEAGVAGGTAPGLFNPAGTVSRAHMATFLAKAMALAPAATGPFTDTAGNPHEANIDALAAAGVTGGCNPDGTLYCPGNSVGRAQMATFIARALGLTPITPPPRSAPSTTTTTAIPPNPGDTKNCTDFATWQDAQAWFDTYHPHYGDVANLDSDGDGVACESLPGAP